MESVAGGSVWAGVDGRVAVALGGVFEWLRGRDLARAGAVCRAWHHASAAPRYWRRLLLAECNAEPRAVRALALHNAAAWHKDTDSKSEPIEAEFAEWSWRDEYVRAVAGWRRVSSLPLRPLDVSAGGQGAAALLHAALAPRGDALVVAADDATVTVFVRTGAPADAWRASWRVGLRRRGWRAAARVQWAPGGAGAASGGRVLVTGPLALADRWELLVLELDAQCAGARVLSRAGCAAGAGGCWLAHDTFLSLELRLLAPRRAVTTIWLNSATQEEQSEFAGVAAPVLRVYNEAHVHFTHMAVVEAPTAIEETEPGELSVDARYIRATVGGGQGNTGPLLVVACGHAGGAPGQATALGCWPLCARAVPPQRAAERGALAERVARMRRAPRPDTPEPPTPTEDELRALCSPPAARRPLHARVLGLTPHPSGRCVWALDACGRATCAALPALEVLRVLETRDPVHPSTCPHYVHPAISNLFLASPVGDEWGRVAIWNALSGAQCAAPAPAPAAVPCALLPPAARAPHDSHAPAQLMVLSGDVVFVWESCATPQTALSPAVDMADEHFLDDNKERQTKIAPLYEKSSSCDAGQDLVSARLAVAKDARRQQYLREVRQRRLPPPPCDEPYRLPRERECARATDGRDYVLATAPTAPPATATRACGPCREQPPPKCVELVPDNECQVRDTQYIDPCAHRPRVIVNIDRTKTHTTPTEYHDSTSSNQPNPPPASSQGFTSRIMKSLNLSRSSGGEPSCKQTARSGGGAGGKAQYAGDTGWCGKIQPVPAPTRCRPPGAAELLQRRICRDIPCGPQGPKKRALHTTGPSSEKKVPKDMKTMAAETKANVEKLEKMMNTRAQLKDTARGRSLHCAPKVALPATGGLELPVPVGARAVRVQVSLDSAHCACASVPPRIATALPCTTGTEKASPCAARAVAATCSTPSAVTSNADPTKCVSRAVSVDDKSKSWLSIKTIQRKIAETCRISETSSKDTCKEPCGPKPFPCASPAPAKGSPCAPPPARKAPCNTTKAPSKKPDCDKKKKPTCFTPALENVVSVCQ